MTENTTITASFVWTLDELKTVQSALSVTPIKILRSKTSSPSSVVTYFILLLIMIAAGVLVIYKFLTVISEDWGMPRIILFGLGIVVLWQFFSYMQRRRIKESFTQQPESNKRVAFLFSDDEIVSKIDGVSESKFKWNVFVEVQRTQKGFILYASPQQYFWIPAHAFQSKEDADALADLARKLAPNFFES